MSTAGRSSTAERFAQRGDRLPHLPQILSTLLARLQAGDSDAAELTRLIEREPALAARILSVVNSAYYQLPCRLSNLKAAIAYLGLAEIYRIVLTTAVVTELCDPGPEFRRYWYHSNLTALLSRGLLSRFERALDPGEVWPAALLHDVGQLVAGRLFPRTHRAVVALRQERRCLHVEAERALDAPAHAELGALLCDRWQLPAAVRDACLYHERERPEDGASTAVGTALCRIVMAADTIAIVAAEEIAEDRPPQLKRRIGALLGCDEDLVVALIGEACALREQVAMLVASLGDTAQGWRRG